MKTKLTAGSITLAVWMSVLSAAANTNEPTDKILLEMETGTNRCYVGQAVPVTIKWSVYPPVSLFKDLDIRLPVMRNNSFKIYDSYKLADLTNSTSLGIPLSGTRAIVNLSTVTNGGYEYTELRTKKIIVPTAPGKYSLEPASITCAMQLEGKVTAAKSRFKGTGDLYQYPIYFDNGFFNREVSPRDIKMSTSSAGAALEVLPLPPDPPLLFSGLTGQYEFSVSTPTNTVRQGDPLVVNLCVTSQDYLSHVKLPPLDHQPGITEHFRVMSDRRLRIIDGDSIVFSQTIFPIRSGEQSIPSMSLCYFDPVSGKYETSRSQPILIQVQKARIIDGSVLGVEIEKAEQKSNILPWILIATFLAAVTSVLYARYARREIIEQKETVDLAKAYQQFRDTILLLKETSFETARDQHHALSAALGNYIAAHLEGYQPGAITFSDVNRLLLKKNANDTIINMTRDLFREIDMCRFSPAAPTMDYETVMSHASGLIDTLNTLHTAP